jgi:hypothetical protein
MDQTQAVDLDDDNNDQQKDDINNNSNVSKYKWHMVLHQLTPTRRSLVVPDSAPLTLGRGFFSFF